MPLVGKRDLGAGVWEQTIFSRLLYQLSYPAAKGDLRGGLRLPPRFPPETRTLPQGCGDGGEALARRRARRGAEPTGRVGVRDRGSGSSRRRARSPSAPSSVTASLSMAARASTVG